MCVVALFTGLSAVLLTHPHQRVVRLVAMISSVVLLCAGSMWCMPSKVVAQCNLFMFLKEVLYVQLPGPLDYFYTADETCISDGPHFSYTFYSTVTTIIGYGAGALGVACFHQFLSKRPFITVFCMTTILKIVASVFDILIAKRVPTMLLGVSDHLVYFFGDAVVFGAVSMIDFMPAVILISRLCPAGMEGTMYAILAGFSNFGMALSNVLGTLLVEFWFPIVAVVKRDGPPCDFSQLPALLFVGHFALPLFILPLAYFLLPTSNICDPLIDKEEEREF